MNFNHHLFVECSFYPVLQNCRHASSQNSNLNEQLRANYSTSLTLYIRCKSGSDFHAAFSLEKQPIKHAVMETVQTFPPVCFWSRAFHHFHWVQRHFLPQTADTVFLSFFIHVSEPLHLSPLLIVCEVVRIDQVQLGNGKKGGNAVKMKGMLEADVVHRKCNVICMIRWTWPWRHISDLPLLQYAPKLCLPCENDFLLLRIFDTKSLTKPGVLPLSIYVTFLCSISLVYLAASV